MQFVASSVALAALLAMAVALMAPPTLARNGYAEADEATSGKCGPNIFIKKCRLKREASRIYSKRSDGDLDEHLDE